MEIRYPESSSDLAYENRSGDHIPENAPTHPSDAIPRSDIPRIACRREINVDASCVFDMLRDIRLRGAAVFPFPIQQT
jgi:hypothetical protein